MTYTKLAEKVLEKAKQYAIQLGHGYVGTEHILYALSAVEECYASDFLKQYKVTGEVIDEIINRLNISSLEMENQEPEWAPQVMELIAGAKETAAHMELHEIGTEHLLLSMLMNPDFIGTRFLGMMNLPIPDMIHRILHELGMPDPKTERRGQEIPPMGPMMEDPEMAGEPGPILYKYANEMTSPEAISKMDPVIGREREIERMMEILCRRTKNNPILLGEAGVGKTALVEGFCQMIARGDVPEELKNKKVLRLDMAAMVAGTKYRGEFEERIKRCMDEVIADQNIILFMDEVHTLMGAGGAEGSMDASNIMKPALSRGQLQLIGATTNAEYHKHIEKDGALARRFQTILVDEPTEEETIAILNGVQDRYAAHHHVVYTPEAIKAAAELSRRYISDRFLPDKAIDILDEAGARKRLQQKEETVKEKEDPKKELAQKLSDLLYQKEQAILKGDLEEAAKIRRQEAAIEQRLKSRQPDLPDIDGQSVQSLKENKGQKEEDLPVIREGDIEQIISLWTGIPVNKVAESDTEKLNHLEERLHERVIGQNPAVSAVAKAVRRGRLGLKDPKRPIGSFLLLGPTGVGKTELSKALAEALFGQEEVLIRIDMSEYMEKYSVSKLIGSAPGYVGYEEGGQLSQKIRNKPYSVVLFDEIEKAHPDVFNILLQVLDDGQLTDSQGRKTDFKNTVILMTSNTGARSIQQDKQLGFRAHESRQQDYERMRSNVMEEVKRMFRPEFLNRIDETIVFHSLSKEEIHAICRLMIKEISGRVKTQWDMDLIFPDETVEFLSEKGYDPQYGARPLRRVLQSQVEDKLSDAILSGVVKRGDSVMVLVRDQKVVFETAKQ